MKKNILKKSPFPQAVDKADVYMSSGKGPYNNTIAALSKLDLSPLSGKNVLLKPNVGRVATTSSGIITNYNVIAATIDILREKGAQVTIGESPITGVNIAEAYEICGITEMAREKNCQLLDMDQKPAIEVAIDGGEAISSLKVCADVFDFDVVVSIPVMKMHMHTDVTLSVKNMKGCLWRRSKVTLHMLPPLDNNPEKPLNIAIADMASVLTPHLAIIDGTIAMEGMGPSAGSAKELDMVLVSTDPFAADAVACGIMGVSAEDVPHLAIGASRGYGIIDMEKIKVDPENWRDFISPFQSPPEDISVEFDNIQILDENSCSACQSTVLLFLKKYGDKIFDYFPEGAPVTLAIGKGHKDVPPNTICIGNCTARHKKKGIFIPGCPPVGSEIYKAITGNIPDDDSGIEGT